MWENLKFRFSCVQQIGSLKYKVTPQVAIDIMYHQKAICQVFSHEEQDLKDCGITVRGGTYHLGSFLNEGFWQKSKVILEDFPLKQDKHNISMMNENCFEEISRFSSLNSITEGDYMLYLFHLQCKKSQGQKKNTLTVDEIDEALFQCIHKSQELAYPEEEEIFKLGCQSRGTVNLWYVRLGGRL